MNRLQLVKPIRDIEHLKYLFSCALLEIIKCERETKGCWYGFDIARDVIYLSGVLADAANAENAILTSRYWHVVPGRGVVRYKFDELEPVLAKNIADGALVHISLFNKLPPLFSRQTGQNEVGRLYHRASQLYPDPNLRPTLGAIGEDLPIWVDLLPQLPRRMSLFV